MKNPKAPDPNEYPEVKKVRPISPLKAVLFLLGVVIIVLIRRMDQMSFRPITEEEALEMAQEITSLGYDNPDIYFFIGNCYDALRDFRQAPTYYRKGADLGNSAAIKMLRDKGYNV